MKKLLALVLALVMVLGLATVSTSAAYSDQDDINNEEAVAVMTAIGIFEGKSGAFDPKANLNRAEAAKIVAYLMLGNETAENLQGTGAKFTDVPASHWAAGYIEYLASVGIVSGVGGGRFDPNGQVTAVQLAKMLLVALGYDAQIEKFVGSDWAINIQSVANKVGIYDGNSKVVSNAAVTRDEAALYALNTIKAPLVEYSTKGTVITIGDASVTTGASNWSYKTTAVKNNGKKLQTIDDTTLNGNDEAYIVEFAEEYYPDLKLESDTNDFGEPIHKWLNKNIEVGTFVLTSDLLETYTAKVTAKTLYDLLGKSRRDSMTVKTASAVTVDGSAPPAAGAEWAWNTADTKAKITVTYNDQGSKKPENLPANYTWYASNDTDATFNFVDGGTKELVVLVDAAAPTYGVTYTGSGAADANGKLYSDSGATAEVADMSAVAAGTYYVKVTNAGDTTATYTVEANGYGLGSKDAAKSNGTAIFQISVTGTTSVAIAKAANVTFSNDISDTTFSSNSQTDHKYAATFVNASDATRNTAKEAKQGDTIIATYTITAGSSALTGKAISLTFAGAKVLNVTSGNVARTGAVAAVGDTGVSFTPAAWDTAEDATITVTLQVLGTGAVMPTFTPTA